MPKVNSYTNIQEVLFDFVPYPFWILNINNRKFLAVNKAALKLYGYTHDEFLEMQVETICPSITEKINELPTVGEHFKTEAMHTKKDGTLVNVEVNSVVFDFNGQKCLHQTITDISELKSIITKLHASEEKFRSMVENSDDMVMRFDRSYRHLYANPICEKYLGIPAHKLIGKNHEELGYTKTEYEYWDSKIEEVFKTGKMSSEVSDISAGNYCFHWDLIPEFDANGHVVSVLSITRDISEFVKTKKELELRDAQLKEANDAQEKLKAIFSKDVRWPLIKR